MRYLNPWRCHAFRSSVLIPWRCHPFAHAVLGCIDGRGKGSERRAGGLGIGGSARDRGRGGIGGSATGPASGEGEPVDHLALLPVRQLREDRLAVLDDRVGGRLDRDRCTCCLFGVAPGGGDEPVAGLLDPLAIHGSPGPTAG